ncbi:polyprenyl synthetase family protein [Lacticaseibacillus sp. GG6-2]
MGASLWQGYPEVQAQLQATTKLLKARTQLHVTPVNKLILGQLQAGGKMLRSGLLFMFSRFGTSDERRLVYAAAAIETLHLATLVHDDVLDAAPTRRGVATIHPTAGNRAAIYAGDYLFAVYFDLLADAVPDVANVGINARVMRRILLGELDQNGRPAHQIPTIHQYLRQIGGKTAALFGLATYQGAYLSHCSPELCRRAYRYGRLLGMSFQMVDDLLDLTTTQQTSGKPPLQDLRHGIYTLPTLFALQHDPQLAALLNDPAQLEKAAARIRQAGVPEARALAARYSDKARATLDLLPAGTPRDELIALTSQLLGRVR